MRFTHLAEFSEYAKYQPFKFYLLIFVIACFPVTYACGPAYIRHHDADARRGFIYRLEVARSCRRKNDTGVCQDYQQEEGRGSESCKRFVSLIDGTMWFMSNLQTSIYGIAPVVNATEVNAFITYYKLKKVNRHEKT